MNVLLFGGKGLLGQALEQELAKQNHNVFIVDSIGLLEDDVHETGTVFAGTTVDDAYRCVVQHEIDVVIDLAEECSIGTMMSDAPMQSLADSTRLTYLTSTYRQKRIVTLYPTWLEDPTRYSSVFATATRARHAIPHHYNKGNAVITELPLPRIIDANTPDSMFGAVVNRVLRGIQYRSFIKLDKQEFNRGQFIQWCSLPMAVDHIMSFLNRTSRLSNPLYGVNATATTIVRYVLNELDIDKIEIYIGNEQARRYTACDVSGRSSDDDLKLREWVRRAVWDYDSGAFADRATGSDS